MASEKNTVIPVERLHNLIYEIRGLKVMLDTNLAEIYGVPTKRLNEQVKRNPDRFPVEFAFQLKREELANLKSQIATSSLAHGGKRKLPWVFTEHGAIMAANVLNTPQAVQMSVFVVRAFLKMRAALSDTRELAHKLATLEKELKDRLNVHDAAIVTILQRIMDIIDPPALPEPPPKKGIGFQVKERRSRYRTSATRNHH
ncbi:MAG: ORF6N domain-containing protein [Verrucomicrobiia bacterium]|jgi:phage regulator Rha-like protein